MNRMCIIIQEKWHSFFFFYLLQQQFDRFIHSNIMTGYIWYKNIEQKKYIYVYYDCRYRIGVHMIHFYLLTLKYSASVRFAFYTFPLRLNWPNWLNNSHIVLWGIIYTDGILSGGNIFEFFYTSSYFICWNNSKYSTG